MPSGSICVVTGGRVAFFFVAELHCIIHGSPVFFIRPFVHGPVGCFHVLASVKNAAVNTGVHVSFPDSDFIFSDCFIHFFRIIQ